MNMKDKIFEVIKCVFVNIFVFAISWLALVIYLFFIRPGEFFLSEYSIVFPIVSLLFVTLARIFNDRFKAFRWFLLAGAIGLFIIIGANEYKCMEYGHFSSDIWKSNNNVRHMMIDDLEENYLSKDMTSEDVDRLLGRNIYSIYENYGEYDESVEYYYSYFSFDERNSKDICLKIYFASDDKIIDWDVSRTEALWN